MFIFLLASASLLFYAHAGCPNWCSQRGICNSPTAGGNCVCDMGFTGDDCGKYICPKSYDPTTLADRPHRRSVRVTTSVFSGKLDGRYQFTFAGSTVFFTANANMFGSSQCTAALKGLKSVSKATCTREEASATSGTGSYLIVFDEFPESPFENNLFAHMGNPALSAFRCNTTGIDTEEAIGALCDITDVEPPAGQLLPDYMQCSNHGSCDTKHGNCSCARGFYGRSCADTMDNTDKVVHVHDGPFFTATMMKVGVIRDETSAFSFFQTTLGNDNVTTMRGDRLMQHNGDAAVRGQMSIGTPPGKGSSQKLSDKSQWCAMDAAAYETLSKAEEEELAEHVNKAKDIHEALHKPTVTLGPNGEAVTEDVPAFDANAAKQTWLDKLHSKRLDSRCRDNVLSLTSDRTDATSTMLTSQVSSSKQYHMRSFHENKEVASIDGLGGMFLGSSLSVGGNASSNDNLFSVSPTGLTTMNQAVVGTSLDVRGSASVDESLTIGTGFALTPGGMTVDVFNHTGTLFELRSRQTDFNGSLLEIHTVGDSSSLIKTVTNDVVTFDLTASGDVTMQSLRMESGGVHVNAGGIEVESGGLVVKGGLTVASGGFNFDTQKVTVSQLRAVSNEPSSNNEPQVIVSMDNNYYAGSLMDLSCSSSHPSHFSYVKATSGDGKDVVLDIRGDGSMKTAGDIVCDGGLKVQEHAQLKGAVSYAKVAVRSSDKIVLPSSATFVVIEDDNAVAKNVVEFPNPVSLEDKAAYVGRIMIITNHDAESTADPIAIPSGSTVQFIYNGDSWVDVEALKSPMQVLKGVKTFEAADDLAIGNHTFEAGRIRVTQLPRYSIPVVGFGGMLLGSDKFAFTAKGVLVTPALKSAKLLGDMDISGNALRNGVLVGCKIVNTSITSLSITVPGAQGLAYFDESGTLTGTTSLAIDSDGRIALSELYGDVDFNEHTIKNATLSNVNISSAEHVSISGSITLQNQAVGDSEMPFNNGEGSYSMAIFDENGVLHSTGRKDFHVSDHANSYHFDEVEGMTMTGDIEMSEHSISNANLVDVKSISGLSDLSVESFSLSKLRCSDSSNPRKQHHVLAVDVATGRVVSGASCADEESDSFVYIPQLEASGISVGKNGVEMQGNEVSNAMLTNPKISLVDSDGSESSAMSLSLPSVQLVSTVREPIASFEKASDDDFLKHSSLENSQYHSILMSDKEGKVKSVSGVGMYSLSSEEDGDGGILIAEGMQSRLLKTSRLVLWGGKVSASHDSSGVLALNPSTNEVERVEKANLDSLSTNNMFVSEELTVSTLTLLPKDKEGVSSNTNGVSLLAVDATGRVIPVDSSIESDISLSGDFDIQGDVTCEKSLVLSKLISGSTEAKVLAVDGVTGVVSSTDVMKAMEQIDTKTLIVSRDMTVSGNLFVPSLIPATSNGTPSILVLDDVTGEVTASSSVKTEEVVAMSVESDVASVESKFVLSYLTGAEENSGKNSVLLTVDSNGIVGKFGSDDGALSIGGVTAERVAANTVGAKSVSVEDLKDGALDISGANAIGANADGELVRSPGTLNAAVLKANAVSLSDHLTIADGGSLFLKGLNDPTDSSALHMLGVDPSDGKVKSVKSSVQSLSELTVSSKLIAKGMLHSEGITWTPPADGHVPSADTVSGVLSLNSKHELVRTLNINGVKSMDVEDLKVSGVVDLHSLKVSSVDVATSSTAAVLGRSQSDGSIVSMSDIELKGLNVQGEGKMDSLTVNAGDDVSSGLFLKYVSSNKMLATDDNGKVVASDNVAVTNLDVGEHLSAATIAVDGDLKLKGPSRKSGVLSLGEDGLVTSSDEFSALRASFNHINVAEVAEIKQLILPHIAGDNFHKSDLSLLATNDKGIVGRSTDDDMIGSIRVRDVAVNGKLRLTSTDSTLVSNVLVVDKDTQEIGTSKKIIFDQMVGKGVVAEDVTIRSSLTFDSGMEDGVLSMDSRGKVFTSHSLVHLENIVTSGDIAASGDVTVKGKLSLTSAAKHAGKADGLNSIMVRNPDSGELEYTNDLKVASLKVTDDFVASGARVDTLEVSNLKFPKSKSTKSSLIGVDSTGEVVPMHDMDIESVSTTKLSVRGRAEVSELVLPGIATTPNKGSLLMVNDKGQLSSMNTADLPAPVFPSDASFASLKLPVDKKTSNSAESVIVTMSTSDGLVGASKPADKVFIPLFKSDILDAKDLSIQSSLKLSSLANSKPSAAGTPLLTVDSDGSVVPSPVLVKAGSAVFPGHTSLDSLSVKSLSSDMNGGKHILSNIRVDGSSIVNSDVVLAAPVAMKVDKNAKVEKSVSDATAGSLTIRRESDGVIAASPFAQVDAHGTLLVSSLGSLSQDSPLALSNVQVQSSSLKDVTITSAVSIETTDFKANAKAEFMSDIFVDGAISSSGQVIAGSFVEMSDARFKRDVSPVVGSLEKVCKLQAVTYNMRVEDFPDRNFSNRTQIGWIADDVEKVFPELVSYNENDDNSRSVSYARSASVLAEAIKELQEKFDTELAEQKEALALMQEENKMLKEKMDKLFLLLSEKM